MSRAKVLLTRPIPARGMKRLASACDVIAWTGPEPMPRADLLQRIERADGIMTAVANVIDRDVIAAAPRLKIIANMGVGYDNVDLVAAAERGIVVTNTPGVLTETTADMAFGLLLAAARRIAEASAIVRGGAWDAALAPRLLGEEVHHSTIGIVGLGRIGQAVARRARGFSMRVIYADPQRTPAMIAMEEAGEVTRVTFETLLAEADFVTLHPDLNPTSRKMMNAAAFGKMKKTAILVNASRGPVVDTDALVQALAEKRIAGCGVDVTDPEPLPAKHALLALPNALVTPHMSTQSRETREEMCDLAARNLVEVLAGRPAISPVRK